MRLITLSILSICTIYIAPNFLTGHILEKYSKAHDGSGYFQLSIQEITNGEYVYTHTHTHTYIYLYIYGAIQEKE